MVNKIIPVPFCKNHTFLEKAGGALLARRRKKGVSRKNKPEMAFIKVTVLTHPASTVGEEQ